MTQGSIINSFSFHFLIPLRHHNVGTSVARAHQRLVETRRRGHKKLRNTTGCCLQRSERPVRMVGCLVPQAVSIFSKHTKKEGYTSVFALLGDGLVKLVAVSSSEAFSFSQDRYASIFETFFCR